MDNPIPWKTNPVNRVKQNDLIEDGRNRTALIFGVGGQDGHYLTKLLLSKNYNVVGVVRRTSTSNIGRISFFLTREGFQLDYADITDFSSVMSILTKYRPHWIFNLAAQSHVGTSFNEPFHTLEATGTGCLNILESLRLLSWDYVRFYQASSSEMFGDSYDSEYGVYKAHQNIDTKFSPQSPYAIAKVMAHQFCQLYRKAYGINVRCGVLFNHESEMRGHEFVTRKITRWIGKYKAGNIRLFDKLQLGNLDSSRDWGHAEDYVRAMVLIMQYKDAKDWVVATGETYTIKEFLAKAFEVAGLESWEEYVSINDKLKRPSEVPFLKGDSSSIREELGWEPTINFNELVKRMVDHDIQLSKLG